MDRALFPFWKMQPKTARFGEFRSRTKSRTRFEQTHVGELVGRCSVVQQQVDDVCVPLLGGLMKGCVTVLQEGKRPLGLPVHAESATADASFLPLSLR